MRNNTVYVRLKELIYRCPHPPAPSLHIISPTRPDQESIAIHNHLPLHPERILFLECLSHSLPNPFVPFQI